MATLKGSYDNSLIEGTKASGLEGSGSLTTNADGSLSVTCRVSRAWLARIFGALGVLAALLFVATLPVMLDAATGYDLMEARKGPMLVAMVALFAMVGAWSAVTGIVDRVAGRRVELSIAGPRVHSLSTDDSSIRVVYDDDEGQPTYLFFRVHEKNRAMIEQVAKR